MLLSLPAVDLVEVDGVDEEGGYRERRGARPLASLGPHLHLQVLKDRFHYMLVRIGFGTFES